MSKTLQRIAIISAGLVILGFLSGCGDGSQAPSASPLPTPIPELTPSPADTPASAQPASMAASAQSVNRVRSGLTGGFKVAIASVGTEPPTNQISVGVLLTNTARVDEPFGVGGGEVSLGPSDDSGVVALTSATSRSVAVPGTSARFALIYQWLLGVSPSQAVLFRFKTFSHQWLVPLLVGTTVSGDSPVTVRPETIQGTAIEAMRITAPGGTTAGALTLPTRVWFPQQSRANEPRCTPIPTGLPERYLLKITADLHTTVAPKNDVQ